MEYHRKDEWKTGDLARSKKFEGKVIEKLSTFGPVVDHTGSTTEIDLEFRGSWIDVKEKRKPLTDVWHILPGVPGENLFVLDELGLRKLFHHFPLAYFLLRDVPGHRMFLASAPTLAVVTRGRIIREEKGHDKAKLVVDMTEFDKISGAAEMVDIIDRDIRRKPWRHSGALGNTMNKEK